MRKYVAITARRLGRSSHARPACLRPLFEFEFDRVSPNDVVTDARSCASPLPTRQAATPLPRRTAINTPTTAPNTPRPPSTPLSVAAKAATVHCTAGLLTHRCRWPRRPISVASLLQASIGTAEAGLDATGPSTGRLRALLDPAAREHVACPIDNFSFIGPPAYRRLDLRGNLRAKTRKGHP